MSLNFETVAVRIPEGANVIFGQSHFIKTVEDLYEVMITAGVGIRFGLAFCEASGERLIRHDGNDEALRQSAIEAAQTVGCGHSFFIFMKNAYPINVLNAVKACQEVCHLYAATANPLNVVVAAVGEARGVVAVLDGEKPLGVEGPKDIEERQKLLKDIIGYKR